MGLSLGASILLGALLAPTDSVLAGDVGVGSPGEEALQREPRLSLSAEAGLNDGLAAPFLLLGILVAGNETGAIGRWLVADVLYAVGVVIVVGAVGGYLAAAGSVRLRDRRFLDERLGLYAAVPTPSASTASPSSSPPTDWWPPSSAASPFAATTSATRSTGAPTTARRSSRSSPSSRSSCCSEAS